MSFIKELFANDLERKKMADERLAAKEATRKEATRVRIQEELTFVNQPRTTKPQATAAVADDLSQIPDMTHALVLQRSHEVIINGKVITAETLQQMKSASERIQLLATVLDKYGVDAIANFLPVAGDTLTFAASLYPVIEAIRLGYPKWIITKMFFNIGVDAGFGVIPFVDFILDFLWKANKKNSKLFDDYLKRVEEEFGKNPRALHEGRQKGNAALTRARVDGVLEK